MINIRSYLRERIISEERKNLLFFSFKNLDPKYAFNENVPIKSFVYSAKDLATGNTIPYQVLKINKDKKIADVISKDYGFSSFYFNALSLIPTEILKQKHRGETELMSDKKEVKQEKTNITGETKEEIKKRKRKERRERRKLKKQQMTQEENKL